MPFYKETEPRGSREISPESYGKDRLEAHQYLVLERSGSHHSGLLLRNRRSRKDEKKEGGRGGGPF